MTRRPTTGDVPKITQREYEKQETYVLDTAAIARLNKIIKGARNAIEIVRAGKCPAAAFEEIKELADGYPS